MKINTIFALAIILISCSALKNPTAPKMDIYILMGQSNMAGRGPMDEFNQKLEDKNVLMLDKELKWVLAKNPLHFDKPTIAAVGPGLTFGIAMQKASNTIIGLVPTAVGGTSIKVWVPGGYDESSKVYPYDDAEKRIKEAMKQGTIKGVIWHQGESDSNPTAAKNYIANLTVLINRIRTLTNNEKLPFVAGELGRYKENYGNINKELANLPALVPYTALASSEGLVDKGDGTHFDAKSANEFGKRYAAKMIELQKGL